MLLLFPLTFAVAISANLLLNPDMELPTDPNFVVSSWTGDSWGGLEAIFFRRTSSAYSGSFSLCVDIKSETGVTSGDAKWIPSPISVSPGDKMIFEGYFTADSSMELFILIREDHSNGEKGYFWQRGGIFGSPSLWNKFSVSFTVRENVEKISPVLYSKSKGIFCQDAFSLHRQFNEAGTTNLIKNPGFESPSQMTDPNFSWRSNKYGTIDVSFFVSSSTYHSGKASACASIESSSGSSDAKWIPEAVKVSPGRISFSGWVWSDSSQKLSALISALSSDGKRTYNWIKGGIGGSPNEWVQFSVAWDVPLNVIEISPYVFSNEKGTFCVDDMVLTADVSQSSLLLNGGFEELSGVNSVISNWAPNIYRDLKADFTRSNDAFSGSLSLCIDVTFANGGDAKWIPSVVKIAPGSTLRYSGWVKSSSSQSLSVALKEELNDGSIKWRGISGIIPSTSQWTQFTVTFVATDNAVGVAPYIFAFQTGKLCMDEFTLTVETDLPPNAPNVRLPTIEGCGSGRVSAITLDDGPAIVNGETRTIIDSLSQLNVKVTFFVSPAGWGADSSTLSARCGLVKELVESGHEVQSHSWNHPDFKQLSDNEMRFQLDRVSQWMVDCGAPRPTMFRPPFGSLRLDQAEKIVEWGYKIAFWNLDTFDYTTPNDFISIKPKLDALKGSGDSLVVLLHDRSSYRVISQVVGNLRSAGYSFIKSSECYARCDQKDSFGICRTLKGTPHYEISSWDNELFADDERKVRCGITWSDANAKCGTSCTANRDCGSNESCFSSLSISPCIRG